MKNLVATRHALEVMADRGVTWPEVAAIVRHPQVTYTQHTYAGRPVSNQSIYQRGELAAVVAETEHSLVVVTVLLRSTQQWTNSDARNRKRSS